jgi:hypothetical protein
VRTSWYSILQHRSLTFLYFPILVLSLSSLSLSLPRISH